MDVYSVTPKGERFLHQREIDSRNTPLSERLKDQDYVLLGFLEEFGPQPYDGLGDFLIDPPGAQPWAFPTKASLHQAIRRLFEAGLIQRMER